MKHIVIIMAALLAPVVSQAQGTCESVAAKGIVAKYKDWFYNEDGTRQRRIESVDCEKKVSMAGKYYYQCGVFASNGQGAGDVEFLALLDKNCTKVFTSWIVGYE